MVINYETVERMSGLLFKIAILAFCMVFFGVQLAKCIFVSRTGRPFAETRVTIPEFDENGVIVRVRTYTETR